MPQPTDDQSLTPRCHAGAGKFTLQPPPEPPQMDSLAHACPPTPIIFRLVPPTETTWGEEAGYSTPLPISFRRR